MRENIRGGASTEAGEYTLSLSPRQTTLLACAGLALAALVFACGVVVGRWYGAAAEIPKPTLASLDQVALGAEPAEKPSLSFHEELSKPSPSPLPAVPPSDLPEAQVPSPKRRPAPAEEPRDSDDFPAEKVAASPKKAGAKPTEKGETLASKELAAPKPTASALSTKKYTLKAGTFSKKADAEAQVKRLKAKNSPASWIKTPSGKFVVIVGTFDTPEDAKRGQGVFNRKHSGISTTVTTR